MKTKLSIAIGSLLIVLGILLNKWVIITIISPDGTIESLSLKIRIWAFEVFLILVGFFIIRYRNRISLTIRNILLISIGLLFIAFGILLNEWVIARIFGLYGVSIKLIVWLCEILFILVGLFIIRYSNKYSFPSITTSFIRYYKISALMFFNTCVLFLFLNVGVYVYFQVKDFFVDAQNTNPVSQKYENISLKEVYPDLNEDVVKELLSETWSRPYLYEPFTQFKERPYDGNYVNVDKNGFRITQNQGAWPPNPNNFNIFLFGGSTTFGYGVPDNQTIASYLQEFLSSRLQREVRVYNFGRGFYYSAQERILLENLLVSGFIPDMTIFIDGLNDFYHYDGVPFYTERLEQFVNNGTTQVESKHLVLELLNNVPISRVIKALKDQFSKMMIKVNNIDVQGEQESIHFDEEIYNDKAIISAVINRYLENKKLIEAVTAFYGVQPIFVWQPAPTYKYNLTYHPVFAKRGFDRHSYSRYGYLYMEKLMKEISLGDNFFWCADVQENLREPLYVDLVHYSAKMSKMFAGIITDLLFERHLIKETSPY